MKNLSTCIIPLRNVGNRRLVCNLNLSWNAIMGPIFVAVVFKMLCQKVLDLKHFIKYRFLLQSHLIETYC